MTWLRAALSLLLCASAAYYLATVRAAMLWRRRRQTVLPAPPPRLTVLKPLFGSDPEQAANLEGFLTQNYPAYQVVFGALDPHDAGLRTAREVAARHPGADAAFVSGGQAFGANRKVCNLSHMVGTAKYELLVVCDSDMRVGPDYLAHVAAEFEDPAVGLVTCPYRGHLARGIASRLEALGIGADFIPSAFVAYYLFGVRFAFGSTIALRRQALTAIGGFETLADELADDYRLAEAVSSSGWEVALSQYVVDDVLSAERLGEMWSRRLRWAKTARAMQPASYAGAFVAHGTALGVVYLLAWGFRAPGWIGLGALFAVRAAAATWIARRCTHDENLPRLLPLLPLSDLVSFALWACSFFGRTISWRGERFRLRRGGRIERAGL